MVEVSDFHQKVLRRASSPDELRIYRAGLEWDLTDPIVIESSDDFKSAPRWKDRLTPFHHQVTNLITFCRRLPVTLLADDVGLGKTISAGLVISELASRSRVSKVLVICPKILGPQWQAELTTKFEIPSRFVTGRELLTADFEEFGAVITTYNSARLYLERIPEDRFQMLVLDEAHKLRNLYGVENTPQVAKCFHKALRERRFRFVLMLTATPIHNRLWDLYSLVDLLTVARGHQNPFGTPGLFARKFIADKRATARHLKSEAIEEFRSVVYSYMSRVRRGDAKLYFPDRIVRRHQVDPTPAELLLIKTIAEPIQTLNRLVQISILKALASSPEALNSQLKNMARNGTIPPSLSSSVNEIVQKMPKSAKLVGLGQLIEQLKKQDPTRWRLVVFTALRETQTTIQIFLENYGLKVGVINGDSGERNQETIALFRATPPQYRVIVSTEAGAEGVNLQAANVLVNFDLPWNPMVVEQRIGRIQRLASEYANVVVYNLTLRGTFEDYIVGRLMEKLQMASHAIGDIDSLLQNSDGSDDDAEEKFEERLLELVLAALAGKDKKKAAELEVASIEEAISTLDKEKESIDELLGEGGDRGYVGPRAPTLPPTPRSMSVKEFTLSGLKILGARISPNPPDLYLVEETGGSHYIRFESSTSANIKSILYDESSTAFRRLVDRVTATALHNVRDLDRDPEERSGAIAREWIASFGGTPKAVDVESVSRRFDGAALVRVRATVLHDSYERLLEVPCSPDRHAYKDGQPALRALGSTVTNVAEVGLNLEKVAEAASVDDGISEFSRFYLDRREYEVRSAGDDERKRRRLFDEFSPRFEATIVGMEGAIHREISVRARFDIDEGTGYECVVTAIPSVDRLRDLPKLALCSKSGKTVPVNCLARCQVTGAQVVRHLLAKSEESGRLVLPEYIETCSMTGKHVAQDEVASSDVSGQRVLSKLLQQSEISGKKAEPEHFSRCSFTGVKALKSELLASEISRRMYRGDQGEASEVSGRRGHISEFTECSETRQRLARAEAEQCQQTRRLVRPGVLIKCEATGKRVLPSECGRCSVTNKVALKQYLVSSSISGAPVLADAAVYSASGRPCLLLEAQACAWSGQKHHPDDLRVCELTGLNIFLEFLTKGRPRLLPLIQLLDDTTIEAKREPYPILEAALSRKLDGAKCQIVSGAISPTGTALAICAEHRTMLGLRTKYLGFVFSPRDREIMGDVAQGKRTKSGWISDRQ
jgi:superfamily II DNA or RNA helicase